MNRVRRSIPRPCVVMALELLPPPEGGAPDETRMRAALSILEKNLARPPSKDLERRVLVTDRRVLCVTPIGEGGAILFLELLALVHLQTDLVAHDMLLRGAITLGAVEARADFAVGAGLVDAERMCDEVALVPRVVVDPRLIVEAEGNLLLRERQHTIMMELGFIRRLLRADGDGLWFVDYLGTYTRLIEDPLPYLEGHRQLVERRLEAATALDRASRSWTWLARYHDQILEERLRDEAKRAPLRVRTRSPLLYQFPAAAKAPD